MRHGHEPWLVWMSEMMVASSDAASSMRMTLRLEIGTLVAVRRATWAALR